MKKFLSAVAVMAVSLLGAGEVKNLTLKDFEPLAEVSAQGDVIVVKGKAQLMMSEVFPIDPAKTYVFSVSAHGVDGKYGVFMPVIMQFDANGKTISCGQVKTIGGTFTELVKPVSRGDKVLYVKDAKLWNKKRLLCIAFNAKEDYSDLPSQRVSWNTITDITEENGVFKVSLASPIPFYAPVGGVRLHENGPRWIYPLGGRHMGAAWRTFTGKISGQARNDYPHNSWAPGAVTAKFGFQINWNKADAVTEIKDIKIEIR
jgi:hypothetical protein